MACLYAMGDPHGCIGVLARALAFCDMDAPGNAVVLLGDYVPHAKRCRGEGDFARRCNESLSFVKGFCDAHPGRAFPLMGNHERDLAREVRLGLHAVDPGLAGWAGSLPFFHETDRQIFAHAGVDETYGELWRDLTYDYTYLGKRPAQLGPFVKDVVAGHTGTRAIAEANRVPWSASGFNGALWDGGSHYFVDGTTERSGVMPVLRYDTESGRYESFLADADGVRADGGPRRMFPERVEVPGASTYSLERTEGGDSAWLWR